MELDSAGTNNGIHVGEEPHHLSQKVAKLNAIDISYQRPDAFTAEDSDELIKIYAMSKDVLQDMKNQLQKENSTRQGRFADE